jgi:hypothetical protein
VRAALEGARLAARPLAAPAAARAARWVVTRVPRARVRVVVRGVAVVAAT